MPKAVILTALKVEYLAVRAHLSDVIEKVHKGTVYQRGRFETNGRTWDILLVQVGMGNERAAIETERALSYFPPDVAMFVGVAGGLKDVGLGDVVAGTKVYAYEYGKASEEFRVRSDFGLGSYPLFQRANQVARDDEWQGRVLPSIQGAVPTGIAAPIAAGAKVVASTRAPVYDLLRDAFSDAVAVEMEGYGFLEAVRTTRDVESIVIRGISDLIDDKASSDSEGWQPKAASHAAAFAFEVLARFHPGGDNSSQDSTLLDVPSTFPTQITTTLPSQATLNRVRGVLPTRVRSFAGRSRELGQVRSVLVEGGHSCLRILAIHGLSGAGKTQLCREYVEQHRTEYDLTYWVSATDLAQATADLAQLADDLGLPEFDLRDLNRSSRVALRWLEQHDDWLLVFDNASPHIISSLLPSSGSGHVLISSNDPNWSSFTTHELRLLGLSPEDAVRFLLQRTGLSDSPTAFRIANSFDCLPLALEQAAAYIETTSIDFDTYEWLLEIHRPALLDEKSPFTEYPESVYSALKLGMQRVSNSLPEAGMLLSFVAHMDSSGIPRGLVKDAVHICFDQLDLHFNDLVFNRLGRV